MRFSIRETLLRRDWQRYATCTADYVFGMSEGRNYLEMGKMCESKVKRIVKKAIATN